MTTISGVPAGDPPPGILPDSSEIWHDISGQSAGWGGTWRVFPSGIVPHSAQQWWLAKVDCGSVFRFSLVILTVSGSRKPVSERSFIRIVR
jgi:hypothetical protein